MSCIGNCNTGCAICKSLVSTTSVTSTSNLITYKLAAGVYPDLSKLCIIFAQAVPVTATPVPIAVTFGSGTTPYYLINRNGHFIYSDQIKTRCIYSFIANADDTTQVAKFLLYCGYRLRCTQKVFPSIIPITATTALGEETTVEATQAQMNNLENKSLESNTIISGKKVGEK